MGLSQITDIAVDVHHPWFHAGPSLHLPCLECLSPWDRRECRHDLGVLIIDTQQRPHIPRLKARYSFFCSAIQKRTGPSMKL